MKICRKCGARYGDEVNACPTDGEALHILPDVLTSRNPAPVPRTPADPMIGSTVEKYLIKRKLGEGGMGIVYEAEHIHIGKKVALKVLLEDYTKKQELVDRFKQEARSASIIGHPNIINVTDFGYTPDGRIFFVMEFLDGEDLASVIEKQGTLPHGRIMRVVKQVCAGLSAAHRKGIIHRDMKPENIFVLNPGGEDETIKILDFGIAKMSILESEGRKLTKTGVVFGTPEYMSPEQAAGKPIDHRIDIYSLGVIMYEMLTGKVPFTGDTFMSILTKHIFEPVPPIGEVSQGGAVPPALEQIVYKCLAKEPEGRFESVDELAAAVQQVAADENVRLTFTAAGGGEKRVSPSATPGQVFELPGEEAAEAGRPRGASRAGWFFGIAVLVVALAAAGGWAWYRFARDGGGEEGSTGPGGADAAALALPDAGQPDAPAALPEAPAAAAQDAVAAPDAPGEAEGAAPATAPDDVVIVRITTTPRGATAEAEGRGTVCPLTPCTFKAARGEKLSLVITRAGVVVKDEVVAKDDLTELEYKMVKGGGAKKPGGGKGKEEGAGKEPGAEKGKKPEPGTDIDMGELKTPSYYKKDGT